MNAVVRFTALCGWVAIAASTGVAGQNQPPTRARPQEPVAAIVGAFKTHDLVAISDAHGNQQTRDFVRTLVRDPRFADAVNDIVVEVGSARYQDLMDRYVRGDDVSVDVLRAAWQNTTVPNQIWADEVLF